MSKDDIANTWSDPDDAPELTDEWFANAIQMDGGKVVKRGGRPPSSSKEQVTLRIDSSVLAHFRSTGPGWQTRINEALRRHAGC